MSDANNTAAHIVSASTMVGSLAGILPPLAALVAIAWYLLQIYESATFQKFLLRFKKPANDPPIDITSK